MIRKPTKKVSPMQIKLQTIYSRKKDMAENNVLYEQINEFMDSSLNFISGDEPKYDPNQASTSDQMTDRAVKQAHQKYSYPYNFGIGYSLFEDEQLDPSAKHENLTTTDIMNQSGERKYMENVDHGRNLALREDEQQFPSIDSLKSPLMVGTVNVSKMLNKSTPDERTTVLYYLLDKLDVNGLPESSKRMLLSKIHSKLH